MGLFNQRQRPVSRRVHGDEYILHTLAIAPSRTSLNATFGYPYFGIPFCALYGEGYRSSRR